MGRIPLRVQPRAATNEISGERNGVLTARVTAAPVDGKANEAVRKLVAKRLGVAPSRVAVVRGLTSRDKLLEVEGMDPEVLRSELGPG